MSSVTFNDATVTLDDMALFAGPRCWLNGSNVNFFLRRLEARLPDLGKHVLLMDPIVASFCRFQMEDEEEREELCRGIEFSSRVWILVPVNDAESRLHGGGSHWSLLVHHIPTNRALHLDSSRLRSNSNAAESYAGIFSSLNKLPPARVCNLEAPVQNDGFSCGLFTCLFAEFLAVKMSEHPDFDPFANTETWLAQLSEHAKQERHMSWRASMVVDVESLMNSSVCSTKVT